MRLTIISTSVPGLHDDRLPEPVRVAYKSLITARNECAEDQIDMIDGAILRLLQPWIIAPIYLSTAQVSEMWGIHQTLIKRMAREGKIDGAVHIGRAWVIPAWWTFEPNAVGRPRKTE